VGSKGRAQDSGGSCHPSCPPPLWRRPWSGHAESRTPRWVYPTQWRSELGSSFLFPFPSLPPFVHSSSFHSFPFLALYFFSFFASFPPFPSLRSITPKIQLGDLGSAASSPSGVWSRAPAKIKFGAL